MSRSILSFAVATGLPFRRAPVPTHERPEASRRGFGRLGARLVYEFMDGRALVALWAKNLTNEESFQTANGLAPIFGFPTRFHGAPRTYGAELRYTFRAPAEKALGPPEAHRPRVLRSRVSDRC